MKNQTVIIIAAVSIVVIGTGVGLGVYFYLNPLDSSNQNLDEGNVLSSGTFVRIDSGHWGEGKVQIVQLPDESFELQFVDVQIANGPDLYVYLSDKSSFSGVSDSAGTFYDLGTLPFNGGNFSMDFPPGAQYDDYNSVLIWCKQFSVVFTYATLT